MYWQIPVMCRIIFGYMIAPALIKKIATAPSRTRALVWQYFFSAILALTVALIADANLLEKRMAAVAIIGAFNAFACYCHWRAVDISLSRTSLFTQADDLICLALGYIILGEGKFLSAWLGIGLILSLVSVFMFTFAKTRAPKANNAKRHERKKWTIGVWVMLYSIIWGVAIFSMRYFSLAGMSLPSYIAAWYSGSYIGALMVFLLGGKKEAGAPLKKAQILRVAPLSLVIWLSLMSAYWAKMLAPITVVQPIFQVSEMIFPTLIGLWIFKEAKELNAWSRMAIVLGLAGGVTIALSF